MAHWLMKTEPEEFSWDDCVEARRKGRAVDRRAQLHGPRSNMKAMKKGDLAFFYHTGDERQIVGIAEIIREAYPDPTDEKGVFVAVDVKAIKPLPKPVTLAATKAAPRLKEMALVKYGRLSVQPVTASEWTLVCRMARRERLIASGRGLPRSAPRPDCPAKDRLTRPSPGGRDEILSGHSDCRGCRLAGRRGLVHGARQDLDGGARHHAGKDGGRAQGAGRVTCRSSMPSRPNL